MSDFASTANVSMILLRICTYTYWCDCPLAECTSCIANVVALFTIKPRLKKGDDSTKMKLLLKKSQIKRYATTEYYCSASVYICKIKWKKLLEKKTSYMLYWYMSLLHCKYIYKRISIDNISVLLSQKLH